MAPVAELRRIVIVMARADRPGAGLEDREHRLLLRAAASAGLLQQALLRQARSLHDRSGVPVMAQLADIVARRPVAAVRADIGRVAKLRARRLDDLRHIAVRQLRDRLRVSLAAGAGVGHLALAGAGRLARHDAIAVGVARGGDVAVGKVVAAAAAGVRREARRFARRLRHDGRIIVAERRQIRQRTGLAAVRADLLLHARGRAGRGKDGAGLHVVARRGNGLQRANQLAAAADTLLHAVRRAGRGEDGVVEHVMAEGREHSRLAEHKAAAGAGLAFAQARLRAGGRLTRRDHMGMLARRRDRRLRREDLSAARAVAALGQAVGNARRRDGGVRHDIVAQRLQLPGPLRQAAVQARQIREARLRAGRLRRSRDVDVLRRLHRDLVGDAITVGRPHGELVFSGRQRLVDQICALRDLEIRVLGTFLHMEADILPDVQAGEGEIVALDIVLSDRAVRQQNGLIFRATRAEVELRIQARAVLALRVGLEVEVRLFLPVYPIDMVLQGLRGDLVDCLRAPLELPPRVAVKRRASALGRAAAPEVIDRIGRIAVARQKADLIVTVLRRGVLLLDLRRSAERQPHQIGERRTLIAGQAACRRARCTLGADGALEILGLDIAALVYGPRQVIADQTARDRAAVRPRKEFLRVGRLRRDRTDRGIHTDDTAQGGLAGLAGFLACQLADRAAGIGNACAVVLARDRAVVDRAVFDPAAVDQTRKNADTEVARAAAGVAVGRQAGHRGIAHDEVAHCAGQLAEQADGMGRIAAHARQNHIVDLVAVSVKRAAEVPHTREGLALHIQLIMQDKLTVRIAGLRGILR